MSNYLVWRDVLSAYKQSQLLFVDFKLVNELLVIYLKSMGSYLRKFRRAIQLGLRKQVVLNQICIVSWQLQQLLVLR